MDARQEMIDKISGYLSRYIPNTCIGETTKCKIIATNMVDDGIGTKDRFEITGIGAFGMIKPIDYKQEEGVTNE